MFQKLIARLFYSRRRRYSSGVQTCDKCRYIQTSLNRAPCIDCAQHAGSEDRHYYKKRR
jgi:uncharacterized paraquat-inducible protein A